MIAWFATKGSGSNEAARLEALLSRLPDTVEWTFDKKAKKKSFFSLMRKFKQSPPQLLIMEGSGISGGMACLLGRLIWKVPYVFSSGDAIGPFVSVHAPWVGALFHLYERLLCRFAAGFIGWTPYLCGRAMTFGCRRAMTAAGWPIGGGDLSSYEVSRALYRKQWGIPEDALVIGLVGALEWNHHHGYCYGLELVEALLNLRRQDIYAVVIGGGSGMDILKKRANGHSRIILPGPVNLDEVIPCMYAMDIGSLPQSTDAVGSFRFTTKLSEYSAARLPTVTSQIPLSYDLGLNWMWRLPGKGPWDPVYIDSLAKLLEDMTPKALREKKDAVPQRLDAFKKNEQIRAVTAFIEDIMNGKVTLERK